MKLRLHSSSTVLSPAWLKIELKISSCDNRFVARYFHANVAQLYEMRNLLIAADRSWAQSYNIETE